MVAPLIAPPIPTTTASGPRVLVISGSVGAGHDGAARELAERLIRAGAVAEVRDLLDAVPRPVARLLRDGYTGTVGHVPAAFEFLFQRLERRGLLWRIEQRVCATAEAAVTRWVSDVRPHVVVSTYPLTSQTLGAMRADGRLSTPVITFLTDPAVHTSWLHPAVDAHLTVTAATADQGSADYGMSFTVAGPLVPVRFAGAPSLEELVDLRRDLGLPAGRPVALLVAGSLGLGDLVPTVRHVAGAGFTPLVLCGHNETLRRRLHGVGAAVVLGWRADVHRLMHVADVLVQNAGGLSFTEAYVAGLPAVTYRPIPGHGRANAEVLDIAGLGAVGADPGRTVRPHAGAGKSHPGPATGQGSRAARPRRCPGTAAVGGVSPDSRASDRPPLTVGTARGARECLRGSDSVTIAAGVSGRGVSVQMSVSSSMRRSGEPTVTDRGRVRVVR